MSWQSWCTPDSRRPPSRIFETESFTIKSAVPEKPMLDWNIALISRLVTKLWPFKYIQNGHQLPTRILSEVKFDDSESFGRSVCTFLPNLVKTCQRRPSYGDLCVFKMVAGFSRKWNLKSFLFLGRHFCFCFVSEPNFVWMCTTATKLWPLKLIFRIAATAILDFVGSEIWRQFNSWYVSPYQIWWGYLKGRPS